MIITGAADAGWHDLQESGAYEWWYLDALSTDGRTAIVLIWFVGLPFSPDYLTDHERGKRPPALDHVALFAAVYRGGRQICYALNRYPRDAFEASRDRLAVRVGPNVVEARDGSVVARFDVPLLLGGSRLVGELDVRPRTSALPIDFGPGAGAADHVWNPLAPDCGVRGSFAIEGARGADRGGAFHGRGYLDHNYGRRPLTEGITRWHWGRAHFDETTVVYYHTEPAAGPAETLLATVDGAGASRVVPEARFEASAWRRRILCPRFPTSVRTAGEDVAFEGTVRSIVDWGPFYMRFLGDATATIAGRTLHGTAISEYFDPRGLRARALRPLVKTRIRFIR